MKFQEFTKRYSTAQLIDSSTFTLFDKEPNNLRRQVRYWLKKNWLIPLKRGVYIFGEDYRKREPSGLFIANSFVSPSYLSMEFALGLYGLIPEKVTVYTSVTSKKTQKYKNSLGVFEYHSVKKSLFFGYKKDVDRGQNYFIALPEKAILDYFYLADNFKGNFEEFESIRFQNLEILNIEKLRMFSLKFNNSVREITELFIKFIKSEARKYKLLK